MSGPREITARRFRETLWALVAAPTVWALHFLFCYFYAAVQCAKGGRSATLDDVRIVIAVATAVALLLVAVSAFFAWSLSRMEGDPPPHQDSTDEDRVRFLAVATLMLAGLSFVAIVFTAIPAFIFESCR
jgi:hypothetical protein